MVGPPVGLFARGGMELSGNANARRYEILAKMRDFQVRTGLINTSFRDVPLLVFADLVFAQLVEKPDLLADSISRGTPHHARQIVEAFGLAPQEWRDRIHALWSLGGIDAAAAGIPEDLHRIWRLAATARWEKSGWEDQDR